jgi:hypothetical protein
MNNPSGSRHKISPPTGNGRWQPQVFYGKMLHATGQPVMNDIKIGNVTLDWNQAALLNVGLKTYNLIEQAKNFQYEIDVTLWRPQKQDHIVGIQGNPVLNWPWGQQLKKTDLHSFGDQMVQHVHDDYEQHGGQQIPLAQTPLVVDEMTWRSI